MIKRILLHLVGVVILIIPWAIRVFEGTLPDIFGTQITTAASQVSQASQDLDSIGNITGYLPIFLWILVLISIVWGIWKRNQKSNIFSMWWLFILLAANPQWIYLPGSGILTNFAIFIAAYIPASVLIGSTVASFLNEAGFVYSEKHADSSRSESGINHGRFIFLSGIISITLLLVGLWYVRPRIRDVQPAAHALLTRPDLHAGNWITQNLPLDAKLLVNSFFAYGGSAVVGSDGGWWLPLTTVRQTTQPPLTYVSEAGLHKDYVAFINELIASIETLDLSHPDVLEELRDRSITHLYIGQQQGSVNGPPLLEIQNLIDNPNFQNIYHEDRVWIFEIIY